MTHLVAPDVRLRAAWLEAHDEWGPGAHEDGFGLRPSDDPRSVAGFAAWVARLTDTGGERCTYRWIVEGDRVLGGIALRHELDDRARRTGQIGYGVRPSARGRGLAGWALGRMLTEASARGLDRVLVVCTVDNVASARTIERHGGVAENGHEPDTPVRRYWITTPNPS